MNTTKLTLIAIGATIIAACSSSKKTTTSTSSAPSSAPTVFVKPANGVYVPGNVELAAIQVQYKDVTLDKLKEGHLLYTQGACINCHGAKNIYHHTDVQWKEIMDDMAQKAHISDAQKDAVYKYVLAVRAVEPK